MKILRRPIEVIAWFDLEGNPAPIRFRYLDDQDEISIVKVDHIVQKDVEKLGGNKIIRYTCESMQCGQVKPFEIRYELETCRWFLYKA